MFISPNQPIRASIRFLLATVLCLFVFGFISRRQVEAAEVIFRPPYNEAADGSTYRITSYFDHQLPDYTSDANITLYTGETFPDRNPYHYSGHPGYDFSMNTGTPLNAVADGTAVVDRDEAGTLGRWVCIQHDDGLASIYGHMNTISINAGPVTVGQLIGTSGATGTTGGAHLHFSVVRMSCSNAPHEWSPTDPFGWQGEEPDPLLDFPGVASTAKCLWRSADQDPISCADRVYEDGGTGVIVTGSGWWTEIDGHGYHKFRRINSAGNEIGPGNLMFGQHGLLRYMLGYPL